MAEWEFAYNGLTFGGAQDWRIAELEGWDDMPTIRTHDEVRPGHHGLIPGLDLAGGRSVPMTLRAKFVDTSAAASAVDDLRTAFAPQAAELPLIGQIVGEPVKQLWCRPRRLSLPTDFRRNIGYLFCDVEFFATDARRYGQNQQTSTVGMPTASSGWSYNWSYNWSYGAAGSGGDINVTNAGNAPVGWHATIDGPVTTPRIEDLSTGKGVSFGLELLAGQSLEVRSGPPASVLLDNQNRYDTAAGLNGVNSPFWFTIGPGTSTVRFNAASGTGQITFRWYDGWW